MLFLWNKEKRWQNSATFIFSFFLFCDCLLCQKQLTAVWLHNLFCLKSWVYVCTLKRHVISSIVFRWLLCKRFFQAANVWDYKRISHLEGCICRCRRWPPGRRCGRTNQTFRWRCERDKHASAFAAKLRGAKAKTNDETKTNPTQMKCSSAEVYRGLLKRVSEKKNTHTITGLFLKGTVTNGGFILVISFPVGRALPMWFAWICLLQID